MRSPHIPFAHDFWSKLLSPDDHVIDATCGNGHDTATLAKLLPNGKIFAFDIQEAAIEKTQAKLFQEGLLDQVTLICASHETFPNMLPKSIMLIVYNLGYLPGGDKTVTTLTDSTLKSIQNALSLLKEGGVIFITLYPGHQEGAIESKAVLEFAKSLSDWKIEHEIFSTKETAPSILIIRKAHNSFIA